jgi:predicted Mrr-cat superfamily restriction endonuclease
MTIGDQVICADGKDIYVGKITSDYTYENSSKAEDGDPNRRSVKWLNKNKTIKRDSLPTDIRSSLKGWMSVTKLSNWEGNLDLLLAGKPIPVVEAPKSKPAKVSTAEKESFVAEEEFDVPTDDDLLTEAKTVLFDELTSDDPERRLTAAIEILNYFKGKN